MKIRVQGFEHYELDSEAGTCYNHRTNRYVGSVTPYGYVRVGLRDGVNNTKNVQLHRLMAEHFIPNPNNLPEVHHINEDKTDNRVENLMWLSSKDNSNAGTRNQRLSKAHSKEIRVFKNDFSKVYPNTLVAGKSLGLDPSSVSKVARGKRKKVGGYKVVYV